MKSASHLLTLCLISVAATAVAYDPYPSELYKGAFGTKTSVSIEGYITGRGDLDDHPKQFSAFSDYVAADPQRGTSSGQAYADLRTGKLGAFAGVSLNANPGPPPNWESSVQSDALMWDTVTITAGGTNLGIIPVRLGVDGTILGSTFGFARLEVYDLDRGVQLLGDFVDLKENVNLDAQIETELAPLTERHFFVKYRLLTIAVANRSAGDPLVSFADFAHTVRFGWDLPAGVTFTSASGVFNPPSTAAVDAVPEPASLAALGLGVAALVRRRRR